jgi:intracellular sulfur oxidation DsrE/DsrF family protein
MRFLKQSASTTRRGFLSLLSMTAALVGGAVSQTSRAVASDSPSDRFPGDPPENHVVYQLNQADPEYIEHILNSISAMLTKYTDNVAIAVVAFGPGVHLLAKAPKRAVPEELRQRVASQARDYGVSYIACGNTMKSLGWTAADMLDFAKIEDVGAAALMNFQKQGYAYIAW